MNTEKLGDLTGEMFLCCNTFAMCYFWMKTSSVQSVVLVLPVGESSVHLDPVQQSCHYQQVVVGKGQVSRASNPHFL